MKTLKFGFSILAMALLATSCTDNWSNDNNDPSISADIIDEVAYEATLDDISESADYEVDYFTGSDASLDGISVQKSAMAYPFGNRYRLNQCPNVTIISQDGGFPKEITLDYGAGIELENGRVLSGKIIIDISASLRTDGATRSISYDEFFVDSIGISGGIISVLHYTAGIERYFDITGDKTFSFPEGATVNRTYTLRREFVAGLDTPFDHLDDVINISGIFNSVTSWGVTYGREIIQTLVKKGDCRFVVEGIVEFTKNDSLMVTLNYGDGECDRIATLTKDGASKEILIGIKRKI